MARSGTGVSPTIFNVPPLIGIWFQTLLVVKHCQSALKIFRDFTAADPSALGSYSRFNPRFKLSKLSLLSNPPLQNLIHNPQLQGLFSSHILIPLHQALDFIQRMRLC